MFHLIRTQTLWKKPSSEWRTVHNLKDLGVVLTVGVSSKGLMRRESGETLPESNCIPSTYGRKHTGW